MEALQTWTQEDRDFRIALTYPTPIAPQLTVLKELPSAVMFTVMLPSHDEFNKGGSGKRIVVDDEDWRLRRSQLQNEVVASQCDYELCVREWNEKFSRLGDKAGTGSFTNWRTVYMGPLSMEQVTVVPGLNSAFGSTVSRNYLSEKESRVESGAQRVWLELPENTACQVRTRAIFLETRGSFSKPCSASTPPSAPVNLEGTVMLIGIHIFT
jgi:hypothetical protein